MGDLRHALLLVEDSSDDEYLSLRAIKGCGIPCDVQVIRHSADALRELLSPEGPDPNLVVLDFHLPGLNGLEIPRELRKNEKTRYVPIVMLSALESNREISDCMNVGTNSCVQKPMDPKMYVENVVLIVRYWINVNKRPILEP